MKPIQVKCPGCGKVYAVSNPAVVGKSTKCKQCGTSFVIQPGEDEEAAAPAKPAARAAAGKPAAATATAAAKPAAKAAAPAKAAPPPPPEEEPAGDDGAGDDEEEEGEDYPDNEPTISVSAYEAQKLREQLRAGMMKPPGAEGGSPDGEGGAPNFDEEPAPAPAPARPAPRGKGAKAQAGAKSGGNSNVLLFVIIGLAVVLGGLAAAYFLIK